MAISTQTADYYTRGILAGDIAILSRAITLVESRQEKHRELGLEVIDALMPHTGRSFRLGVTGVPGVGKSTFIEKFGLEVTGKGHRLAVLAVDPSSSRSGGSILGDKTRMQSLSVSPDVYIRPSPSGGTLGGVTRVTYETILLCEAAGYDYIIIETVGVGQSETAVSRITDFFLLLMLAGAGDELQGIKRGIMEMADGLLITKADGANVEKARAARSEYAHAMHLLQPPASGWIPRAMICSSVENTGIREVYEMLEEYRRLVSASHYFHTRRREQQIEIFRDTLHEEIVRDFYRKHDLSAQIEDLRKKEHLNPFREADRMIRNSGG